MKLLHSWSKATNKIAPYKLKNKRHAHQVSLISESNRLQHKITCLKHDHQTTDKEKDISWHWKWGKGDYKTSYLKRFHDTNPQLHPSHLHQCFLHEKRQFPLGDIEEVLTLIDKLQNQPDKSRTKQLETRYNNGGNF